MHVIGIIAARMASTRFPDKPLTPILGMPMIGHVLRRAAMANSLDDLWVATCDQVIVDYVESIGGKAVMTADTHERALDRAAEAAQIIERRSETMADYVVMIQGDEPMLAPEMIDELVAPAHEGQLQAANLVEPIHDLSDFESADTVKAVMDQTGHVLYFSREPVPSRRKYTGEMAMWKQLGLIMLSRSLMAEFPQLPPTDLEIIESVDMNRLLSHGRKILGVPTRHATHAVDRPNDVSVVEQQLRDDPLLRRYLPAG